MYRVSQLPAAVLIIAMVAGSAAAGSIYSKASHRTRSIYADDTARDVGDLLTIQISERTVVSSDTNRSLSKKTSRKMDMAGDADLKDLAFGQVVGAKAFRFPKIGYDSSSENKFDGSGTFDTSRSITDQITVTVEDVLPNGNLVILGTRDRQIAGEKQTIQISGIVRPSDIAFTNTIGSQKVADFRLVVTLDGSEKRATSPGWFTWIMNVINPF